MTPTLRRHALALEVRGHGKPLYVAAGDEDEGRLEGVDMTAPDYTAFSAWMDTRGYARNTTRTALSDLPDQSVNCCVTSPPYWGLRDYGVDGQIGLEEGRDFIGIELNPEYVGLIEKRLAPLRTVSTLDTFAEAEA